MGGVALSKDPVFAVDEEKDPDAIGWAIVAPSIEIDGASDDEREVIIAIGGLDGGVKGTKGLGIRGASDMDDGTACRRTTASAFVTDLPLGAGLSTSAAMLGVIEDIETTTIAAIFSSNATFATPIDTEARFFAGIFARPAMLGIGLGVDTASAAALLLGGATREATALFAEVIGGTGIVARATMGGIALRIDATPLTFEAFSGASADAFAASAFGRAASSTRAAMARILLGIEATAIADGRCDCRAACDALSICTDLARSTSAITGSTMQAADLGIEATTFAKEHPCRAATSAALAKLPLGASVSTGIRARSTMASIRQGGETTAKTSGWCRLWAVGNTSPAPAEATRCTRRITSAAMRDIAQGIDAAASTQHKAAWTRTTATFATLIFGAALPTIAAMSLFPPRIDAAAKTSRGCANRAICHTLAACTALA